jgi:Family of unknown function (DUF6812)
LALQLSSQLNDALRGNARLKQVKVLVCTETCAFNGYAYCGISQRLLDTLNQNVSIDSMALGREFLLLADVEVAFPNGARKSTREAIIRKSSILFVGEKNESQPEISELKDRQLNHRLKPKTPLAAEIHLPLYALKGHIYGEVWQQMLDVVDKADKFIALTDVQVVHISDNAELTFNFVAVNRDKIIYIGEPTPSAEPLLP